MNAPYGASPDLGDRRTKRPNLANGLRRSTAIRSVSDRFGPFLYFLIVAASFYLWFARSAAQPLWADELITVELVKSASFKHMLSAITLGFDATPPLYTGYGWLMLHDIAPAATPESLLRVTNAILVMATIVILYLAIRAFFNRVTAITATSLFLVLEQKQLEFLTLEIRTYAAFVLAVTAAIYVSLIAIRRRSLPIYVLQSVCYCLLVASHTFGIVYVVCIAASAAIAAVFEADLRGARNSALVALPPLVMFAAWLPILRHQAQLGSWIPKPGIGALLEASYLPAPAMLLVPLTVLALITMLVVALVTLWKRNVGHLALLLAGWWRSITRTQKFILLIPVSFGGSTLAVWVFAKIVFPVFVARYFSPNLVLHAIWVSLLVHLIFARMSRPSATYALSTLSIPLALLSIAYRPFHLPNRIPCFDPARNAYLEDPFKDGTPILALWSHTWLTRLHHSGEQVIFPVDEIPPKQISAEYPGYDYEFNFTRRFAAWSNSGTVKTTQELLVPKRNFMVLDDDKGPWLKLAQESHKLALTKLAEMEGCKLWRVRVDE